MIAFEAICMLSCTLAATLITQSVLRTFTRSFRIAPAAAAVHASPPRKIATTNPRGSKPPAGTSPRRDAGSLLCDGSSAESSAMPASQGSRSATVAPPPVTAVSASEPVASTHRARCAKRSARSTASTAAVGANACGMLARWVSPRSSDGMEARCRSGPTTTCAAAAQYPACTSTWLRRGSPRSKRPRLSAKIV